MKLTDNGDGTYTFTQPKDSPVTVKVTFDKATGNPDANGVGELLMTSPHVAYLKGDDQGNFRPTDNITRAEAVQLFYNLLKDKTAAGENVFTDVAPDAWYAQAVGALAGMGIVNGRGEGVFDPAATITRAEFVAIATRFAYKASGTVTFPDVSTDHWAREAIGSAVSYGWIKGYEDGTFRPVASITRAEAVSVVNAMLSRAADRTYVDEHLGELKTFPDVPAGDWSYYPIVEAVNSHDFTTADGVESWTE